MNTARGTIRLVTEDAFFFFGKFLFLFLTIPLMIGWILAGFFFGLNEDVVAAISGPAYFFIPMFAVAGFRSLMPVAVAFGGTRTQLMRVFYSIGLGAITLTILLLNVLQFVLLTVYDRWIGPISILHPGVFFIGDYHFFAYFWVDLMIAFFLFGSAFLLYCIFYRLGFKKMVLISMVLGLIGMFLYYGDMLDIRMIDWIWNHSLAAIPFTSIIGVTGIVMLIVTYPLMKDAPLNQSEFNIR